MTPKAIIHQRFGTKASYKVEEVHDATQNGCPGLAISQKGPCLYRCTLHLPEISVVSGTFTRKKDAEQSAADMAIEKLGISQKEYNPTIEEAWDDLAGRIAFLFSNEFLSTIHPLSSHFRASLRREGHFNGCIPVVVFAAYDAKTINICKYIINEVEVNSRVVMPLILRAATKVTDLVVVPDDQLSLKRRNPYPSEIITSVTHEKSLRESSPIEAIFIPASFDNAVNSLSLTIASNDYYLDVIARELHMKESSDLLISRTIGKSSSEMRMYSSASKQLFVDQLPEGRMEQTIHFEGSLNVRASYLAGQEVYGDVILASVGYTWRSSDLWHDAVSLKSYYRMLINMIPCGIYKISREAILTAKLPSTFTTKSNWRGSLPKDILCAFCRFHHLSEPVFSIQSKLLVSSLAMLGSCKTLKVTKPIREEQSDSGLSAPLGNTEESFKVFNCEIKLYTKKQEFLLQCSPHACHRKQTDAMNSSSLKVLSWLNIFFEEPGMPSEKLNALAEKFDIHFAHPCFFKEFTLCNSMHNTGSMGQVCNANAKGDELVLIDLGGKISGGTPSNGSLACISYTVSLFAEDVCVKEHLESCEEFEFELGNEGVLPQLESAVAQMSVGQSAYFQVELPPIEFILAAAGDSAATLSLLSSRSCKLEYCVTLFQVTEPLEERMEQALFSPPLSKQRVEFALKHIKESSALSLVDFGCGSGSLLDSLLSYPTSLEKIVGVDISQRSLARAAKLLHSKLNKLSDSTDPSNKIKSAVLYDGSITNFDSRLRGFDIATCLEVIEHMEEKDACIFGDVVLSCFCPQILIVSTPNYEYNVILQRSSSHGQEADDNQGEAQAACKFRNHDHKFEWTRAEFNQWASDLAARHKYGVEFCGVGGAGDVEPGFASQIALFRRHENDYNLMNIESAKQDEYATIWEWREGVKCNEA